MELLFDTQGEILRVKVGVDEDYVIIGKKGLENIVPHRGMALCLDQINYMPSVKDHLFASWTPTDDYFLGHFPEKPVLPGHWQAESSSITAAVLAKLAFPEIKGLPALAKLEIDFKRPVYPGDLITLSVAITERQRRIIKFSFKNSSDTGKTFSEGTIVGMPMAV